MKSISLDNLPKKWHSVVAVSLLLLVLFLLYLITLQPILDKHKYYRDNIEASIQKLNRYRRIIAREPELTAKLEKLNQDQSHNHLYLGQQSDALAATQLRQWVKTAVESNGGILTSTQNLPVINNKNFFKIGIKVRLSGGVNMLRQLFYTLESHRPLLFIENLQISGRQIRQRSRVDPKNIIEKTELTVNFDLYGYMRGMSEASNP
ncbi:type II secretion system protein GspM [Candidatus Nitrosacidococcus tergens]|uniref:General secretion pathway protein M n=1 Tax=Candidatus Nitrosacidococcus tergens TaxID=553981 RepID=A0A7G1Q7W5_9GAMM|nr:type II secretion system protein GspM [Candidatus Nitrosacidococcus tergens]CAB1274325.1 General secretion pathway protein M [Candidatus Nitrosacidococcus tergens]